MVEELPRIALPDKETRALFAADVVAVRARTARLAVVARDDAVFALRATTLRDGVATVLARDAVFTDVAREEVLDAVVRDVVLRAATLRDGVAAVRAVVTAVFVAVVRGLARPLRAVVPVARADCAAAGVTPDGALGSANTARIDTSVEHTKNAPASKKTVPTAFLQ